MLCVLGLATLRPQPACAGCGCTGCVSADVVGAVAAVNSNIAAGYAPFAANLAVQVALHHTFLIFTFYESNVKPAMQAFTMQMTSVGMQQLAMIGGFFDAKQQLETQRLFQQLQVQAHKDYQPSRDFCYFGTNTRSLAASEEISKVNSMAINTRQMARQLSQAGTAAAGGKLEDKVSRWARFKNTYCDVRDNNWVTLAPEQSGLAAACGAGAANKKRVNADIDYTRTIDLPRTLDVAFYESRSASTEVEQDVMAMSSNLFGHNVPQASFSSADLQDFENQKLYMALRSVAAKRNVAESSYNAIVGLKSSGSKTGGQGMSQTRQFLAAVIKELGVPEDEVFNMIGTNPSYYAQLEILAKKIYQTPNFFAGLYDKPANVERKSVALKAIELMLDRAIYESQIRQEMSMSVLLSAKLEPEFKAIDTQLSGAN